VIDNCSIESGRASVRGLERPRADHEGSDNHCNPPSGCETKQHTGQSVQVPISCSIGEV
jgi:hypothetical protein